MQSVPTPDTGPVFELQRSILEASPNPMLAVDGSGRITYVNPQAELAFGYPSADLIGQSIEILVVDAAKRSHVAARAAWLEHPIARPMGIGMDLAARRRDGTEFPVEISLSPVPMPSGLAIIATVVDISARKAAEAALAGSELRFRAVLESSPNPIVGIDRQATITYANPKVEAAFGYTSTEVLGQPIEMLLPERVRTRHVEHRTRFMERPVARPMGIGLDLAGRRKDGREFPVEISLSPVETPDGLLVFATVVDITARKSAEAQLLQAQKLESIGRLAGGVAHDFNNILFAINGYTELLIEDMAGTPPADLTEVRESLLAIQGAADRGANLTMQLLAFSRQQIVSQKVVEPVIVITALEPMLRRLIGEHIQLKVVATAPDARLRIDPGQLDQIVMNLVVNARDAMPSGGSVTIEIGTTLFDDAYAIEHFEVVPGSYVMIAVSDNGQGMDRETREHIFEPFFTTKERGQGTGLGLATIYGIVRQAGGHIWLYSEPGHGSTFKIYFPSVEEAPTPVPAAPDAGRAAPRSGSILLVEDEPSVREMTRRVLERAGYSVTTVEDGSRAMTEAEARAAPFDVLVTDVVMPRMSGIELATWMLDRYPRTGVVLLSGYTAETLDLERLLARGAQVREQAAVLGRDAAGDPGSGRRGQSRRAERALRARPDGAARRGPADRPRHRRRRRPPEPVRAWRSGARASTSSPPRTVSARSRDPGPERRRARRVRRAHARADWLRGGLPPPRDARDRDPPRHPDHRDRRQRLPSSRAWRPAPTISSSSRSAWTSSLRACARTSGPGRPGTTSCRTSCGRGCPSSRPWRTCTRRRAPRRRPAPSSASSSSATTSGSPRCSRSRPATAAASWRPHSRRPTT